MPYFLLGNLFSCLRHYNPNPIYNNSFGIFNVLKMSNTCARKTSNDYLYFYEHIMIHGM